MTRLRLLAILEYIVKKMKTWVSDAGHARPVTLEMADHVEQRQELVQIDHVTYQCSATMPQPVFAVDHVQVGTMVMVKLVPDVRHVRQKHAMAMMGNTLAIQAFAPLLGPEEELSKYK